VKRGAPLKRKTPLRQVSAKRAAKQPKRQRDTGPDRATRDLVLDRDLGCVMCGNGPYGLQVHHRKPRRMGGRTGPAINSPANLVAICAGDHAWAESNREAALDLGLLVREGDDPAQVWMHHAQLGVVLLAADGTVELAPKAGA